MSKLAIFAGREVAEIWLPAPYIRHYSAEYSRAAPGVCPFATFAFGSEPNLGLLSPGWQVCR